MPKARSLVYLNDWFWAFSPFGGLTRDALRALAPGSIERVAKFCHCAKIILFLLQQNFDRGGPGFMPDGIRPRDFAD